MRTTKNPKLDIIASAWHTYCSEIGLSALVISCDPTYHIWLYDDEEAEEPIEKMEGTIEETLNELGRRAAKLPMVEMVW